MEQTYFSTNHDTDTGKRFQCRHIHTDGNRCGSPCLRGEPFCYYHHTTRRPISPDALAARRAKQGTFALAAPSDRLAIQVAIGEVLERIAANEIDTKRAGLLLYGLQIASINLPREPRPETSTYEGSYRTLPETIEEVDHDADYGLLAPVADFQERHTGHMTIGEAYEKIRRETEAIRAAKAGTVPNIQACAARPPHRVLSPSSPTLTPDSAGLYTKNPGGSQHRITHPLRLVRERTRLPLHIQRHGTELPRS
jgi:hypothetical protein